MPQRETPEDRENDRKAMMVMEREMLAPMVQTPQNSVWDFNTVAPGCIFEHRRRNFTLAKARRRGSIYIGVKKFKALMAAAGERGDDTYFVVTLDDGAVIYANLGGLKFGEPVFCERNEIRDPNDAEYCYGVPISAFIRAHEDAF